MERIKWILPLIATVAMILLMRQSGKKLVTDYTPAGIINLELARSKSNVKNILNIWSQKNESTENLIQVAKNNTYLDFLFIACYTSLLFYTVLLVSGKFSKRSQWAQWGRSLTHFCLAAGVLDVFENIGLLFSLNNQVSNNVVLITFSTSLIKWIIIGLVVCYLLLSVFIKAISGNPKKKLEKAPK